MDGDATTGRERESEREVTDVRSVSVSELMRM